MKWEWQRLRRPLGLRSRRCAGTTASKCGTMPSTKLGLRLPLPLGKHRVCIALLPSVLQALRAPRLTLPPKEVDAGKESPAKALPLVNSLSKEAEQPEVAEKEADITKEVAHDAVQPPAAPKDPSKEKEASHNMEIVLETLPMPIKEDLKGKGLASFTVAFAQPAKPP